MEYPVALYVSEEELSVDVELEKHETGQEDGRDTTVCTICIHEVRKSKMESNNKQLPVEQTEIHLTQSLAFPTFSKRQYSCSIERR